MATPKEQHDARPNARNIGLAHRRALPADATPPEGVRALTSHDHATPHAAGDPPRDVAPHPPREPAGSA